MKSGGPVSSTLDTMLGIVFLDVTVWWRHVLILLNFFFYRLGSKDVLHSQNVIRLRRKYYGLSSKRDDKWIRVARYKTVFRNLTMYIGGATVKYFSIRLLSVEGN